MVDIRFRYKVALSCIVVMMVFVTMSGFSYAYFTAVVTGSGNNLSVTTEGVNLTYTAASEDINLTNAKPLTDGEGLKGEQYKFNLTNNNSYDVTASIYLSVDKSSTLAANNIRVAYVKAGETFSEETTKPFNLTGTEEDVRTPVDLDGDGEPESYLLDTIEIPTKITKSDFTLLLWIRSDVNEVIECDASGNCEPNSETTTMGKTFKAVVTVKTEPKRDPQSVTSNEPVVPEASQNVVSEPEAFDAPQEVQETQPEASNTSGVIGLETVTPEENNTQENVIPNENDVQNSEGMESPSVE